jgi:hypothetical protein
VQYVYDSYLHSRGNSLELDVQHPTQRSVIRLCCMMRLGKPEHAATVMEAFNQLNFDDRTLLNRELKMSGVLDGWAILLYYAPATLLNLQAGFLVRWH